MIVFPDYSERSKAAAVLFMISAGSSDWNFDSSCLTAFTKRVTFPGEKAFFESLPTLAVPLSHHHWWC
jgi:hypothetical protein